MNIEIICNKKGTGKTTFILNNYFPYKYYTGTTYRFYRSDDTNEYDQVPPYCIVDSVESIPEQIFDDIINEITTINYQKIFIIFDIEKKQLATCHNFKILWKCGLLPRGYKYSNFIAEKEVFYNFFHEYYPQIEVSQYDSILKITNYNFNDIDYLMLLNQLYVDENKNIDNQVLAQYIEQKVHEEFQDIPDADLFLKKSTIIGEQFTCDALESPNGFGYEAASIYLKQMEKMHVFIRSCIDIAGQYEFVYHDIYQGLYESISHENKKIWSNILINYYCQRYEKCHNIAERCFLLDKLKNLYKLFSSRKLEQKAISFCLLYEYRKSNNTYKALEIAEEIVCDLTLEINSVEYEFIQNFRIATLMQNGEYKQALEILREIHDYENYSGSRMFINYYYALCLYQTGEIDMAYNITLNIVDYLKNISGNVHSTQELFCLTYSLMSTLQNHLGLEDSGLRYYTLALNNAFALNDKTYYYNILKKCDMFLDYLNIKKALAQCIIFYEKEHDKNSAGEVCLNLATEMLFQDCAEPWIIKDYFERGLTYFSGYHNEKEAYARNNMGLYYIIAENNIEEGLKYFKKALFAGLSDFSYMTIYLNICMCYIVQGEIDSKEFRDAKEHFDFEIKTLSKRQHHSIYEKIYKDLLEIIIAEHKNENVIQKCEHIKHSLKNDSFYIPLLSDIIKRNSQQDCILYTDNNFFYTRMNQLRSFFVEFRFWE